MTRARYALALLSLLVSMLWPRPGWSETIPDETSASEDRSEQEREGQGAPAQDRSAQRNWERFPPPDRSENVRTGPDDDGGADVARTLLFVPRLAFEAITAPVHGALYLADRYHVAHNLKEVFFNEEGTFGAYPVVFFATGFGFNAGARLVATDLFGASENLGISIGYGQMRREARVGFGSGDRLGDRFSLQVSGGYELRPSERFFGVGNIDRSGELPEMPLDPFDPAMGVASRFTAENIRGGLGARIALPASLYLDASSTYERKRFDEAEAVRGDVDITRAYQVDQLPGFDETISQIYNIAQIRYDTRRRVTPFATAAVPGAGQLLALRGGYTYAFDDRESFFRYGAEAQTYFNLYHGNRLLGLRAMVEGVSGDVRDIPIVNLPRIGGDTLLRGYTEDQFRDRTVALASVEYWWTLNRFVTAELFVDVGRVQSSLADLRADDLRVGYGGGFVFHTASSFLMNLTLSSSIDGNFFVNAAFSPTFNSRVERN